MGSVIVLFLILVIGIYLNNQQKKQQQLDSYQFPSPEAVVQQYFEAWSGKDYVNMYAAISDGFKRIEPTAKDLSTFRDYVRAQGLMGVRIISIGEKSNDGSTATVDYETEFIFTNGQKQPFKDTFTLKYRPGDVIQGWKLIHPYGEKVDTS